MYEFVSLAKWVDNFGLCRALFLLLEEFGVEDADDLTVVYGDADLMKQCKEEMSAVDYKRFVSARDFTEVLCACELAVIDSEVSAPLPVPVPMPNIILPPGLHSGDVTEVHHTVRAAAVAPPPPALTANSTSKPPPAYTAGATVRASDVKAGATTRSSAGASGTVRSFAASSVGGASEAPPPPYVSTVRAPPTEADKRTLAAEKRMLEMAKELKTLQEKQDTAAVDKKLDRIERDTAARETKKRLHDTKGRLLAIGELEPLLRQQASLDLVFLLDCTMSMDPYIDNCKNQIMEFAMQVSKLYPHISLKLAFVGYRDHDHNEQRLVVQRFTTDVQTFVNLVRAEARPIGGQDVPEDVLGGMAVVAGLDWSSVIRILYHIGDAPCHGSDFHDEQFDRYPKGCPNNVNPREVLTALKNKEVQYFFGKLTNKTDKMIKKFNSYFQGPPDYISCTPMNGGNMMQVITKSVTVSMSVSLAQSRRTGGDGKGATKMKLYKFEGRKPNWNSIPFERVHKFRLDMPASLDELVNDINDNCLSPFPILSEVKSAPNPFDKGACRVAYFALQRDIADEEGVPLADRAKGAAAASSSTAVTKETKGWFREFVSGVVGSSSSDPSVTAVVQKESMLEGKDHQTREKYEETLACHRAATYLARLFNDARPTAQRSNNMPAIVYCDVHVLQFMERPGQPFRTQEQLVEGAWEKYNNNTGFCTQSPTLEHNTNHDVVQCFSHWTYHKTEGKMLVVDCQGAWQRSQNRFLLTDPAIHCAAPLRFGMTNLAGKGFERFIYTHECNNMCRLMNLPSIKK